MRTNYMYARMKRSVVKEIFALTICLWVKPGTGPGLGTPFSYAVPGQANELVLIEWGGNPMELLINDEVKPQNKECGNSAVRIRAPWLHDSSRRPPQRSFHEKSEELFLWADDRWPPPIPILSPSFSTNK